MLNHLKFLRVQSAKTCSLQAISVMQHYLTVIGRYNATQLTDGIGMVNASKYEAQKLTNEQLYSYQS
jgi:hypothetical protein